MLLWTAFERTWLQIEIFSELSWSEFLYLWFDIWRLDAILLKEKMQRTLTTQTYISLIPFLQFTWNFTAKHIWIVTSFQQTPAKIQYFQKFLESNFSKPQVSQFSKNTVCI